MVAHHNIHIYSEKPCAGQADEEALDSQTSLPAMHPDWQLFLHAVQLALLCNHFMSYEDHHGLVSHFGSIVQQLEPNTAAQMNAAALLCRMHASCLQHPQDLDELEGTLEDGQFDVVFAALSFGCQVSIV